MICFYRKDMDSFRFIPDGIRKYIEGYPFEQNSTCPLTRLTKPPNECIVGLVTTAGLFIEGLEPSFDLEREKKNPAWGDPTFRHIPLNADRSLIRDAHRHYNHGGVRKDLNVLFPVDRLLALKEKGRIRGVSAMNFSFMGYIPDLSPVKDTYAPQVAKEFKEAGADVVLMVPS